MKKSKNNIMQQTMYKIKTYNTNIDCFCMNKKRKQLNSIMIINS